MARRTSPRRIAAAVIAVVGVLGLSAAAASQLSIGTGTLQSGVAAFADCQPSTQTIGVTLASATFSGGQYRTNGLTLSNIATACQGKAYRLQLADPAGTPVGGLQAGTIAGTSLSLSFTAVPTASIAQVALIITD